MRAVFLDRDGTINNEADALGRIKRLRILPGAVAAIKKLNKLGFLVIVVTNQAVVARGLLARKEIDEIHAMLIRRLKKQKAVIDAVYYCPHHPNAKLKRYRFVCKCRKPDIGMIVKAVKRFKIDVRKSFMIGDATGDILAGKRAGLKTILVKTGFDGKDGKCRAKPDFVAENIGEAAEIISKNAE